MCWPAGRAPVNAKAHGAAAYRALDLLVVARDGELTAGLAAEDRVLADVMGDELRAFDLVQRWVRRLVRAPGEGPARPVTRSMPGQALRLYRSWRDRGPRVTV